jgi:hypothetical protein
MDSDHDVGGTILDMLLEKYSITMNTGRKELQVRGGCGWEVDYV